MYVALNCECICLRVKSLASDETECGYSKIRITFQITDIRLWNVLRG